MKKKNKKKKEKNMSCLSCGAEPEYVNIVHGQNVTVTLTW